MKLFTTALKFNSLFAGKICQSSWLANDQVQSGFDSGTLGLDFMNLIKDKIVYFFSNFIYLICSFILNFIEVVQIAISRILGIGRGLDEYVVIDNTNPLVKIILSDEVLNTFKTVLGMSIVLIIIFTIIAIIKSEYKFAVEEADTNGKGRILGRTLRSLFTLGMFPLLLLVGVILTNAILAGFNDILRGGENTSIASQVFISSAYSANNYRNYAEDDQRIPVVVNFEDPIRLGQASGYSAEELAKIYKSFQDRGRKLYNSYADRDFGSFNDTIVYKNNRITNSASYSGFEKFAVTREQYYVMADFLDYAVKNNIRYYIKNIKDVDIDWKYVSDTVFNKETCSLSITYKDASNLSGSESYKVVYTPTSESVSSPISDALKTISALLAFDEYSDNTFNILKRLEDSINIVEWETDKVLVRFSDDFAKAILNRESKSKLLEKMTTTDLLILYEQARYAYNNSIDSSVRDIAKEGFELPVKKVTKRMWQPALKDYSVTEELYVVSINGTYYEVELNKDLKDETGALILDSYKDPYYTLLDSTFGLDTVYGTEGGYYVRRDGATVEVDDNEVVTISLNNFELGKFAKNEDSFKDITITLLNGTQEVRNETGLKTTVTYDDQIEPVIKQSAWPNKLIRDLQVMYKDININNLIANGNWLEQLSEYVGGNFDAYGSNIQTGLIHPIGLILSEFLLGNVSASEKVLSFGSLEYSTKFDNDTIKALILSMLGEDRYFQTSAQLNYFLEFFNAYMAPVLDELAYYENFELLSGNEQSVQLYTYKAYLASVLMSSSASEWLYNTACSLLGAVYVRETIVDGTTGYYKKYSDLPDYYKSLLVSVYNTALDRLEKQYVYENDKAYPEYMKALKSYIYYDTDDDAKDYFGQRLENILKSVMSETMKGQRVDTAKTEIKKAYYNSLYPKLKEVESRLNGLKGFDSKIYWSKVSEFVFVPSSVFSYEKNDYVESSFVIGGKKLYDETSVGSKDHFDNIEDTVSLGILKEDATLFASSYSTQGSFRQYIMDLFASCSGEPEIPSNLFVASDAYFNAVRDYSDKKIEYYEQDNSKSNVGEHDNLESEANAYFNQAKKLFNNDIFKWLKENVKWLKENDRELSSVPRSYLLSHPSYSANNRDDFASTSSWEKLKSAYSAMNSEYEVYRSAYSDEYLEDPKNSDVKKEIERLGSYIESVGNYIKSQTALDRLNRYEIVFACESEMSDDAIAGLNIVVNSKHYTVGQNFTKAKFIEYVLGYDLCKNLGYTPVFVDEGYEGIVKLEVASDEYRKQYFLNNVKSSTTAVAGWWKDTTGKYGTENIYYEHAPEYIDQRYFISYKSGGEYKYYKLSNSFSDVHDFAVQLGEISAQLYQMSNLANLSSSSIDEILVGEQEGTNQNTDLAEFVLNRIIEGKYLPEDIVRAFFNTDSVASSLDTFEKAKGIVQNATKAQNAEFFNTVMSYLLLTDNNKEKKNYVDYNSLTLKEIRIKCLKSLIDYEEQSGETTEQNQKRYLACLALGCSDWVTKGTTATTESGALDCNWTIARKDDIKSLKVNNQSQAVILRLAGLENRPYDELIDAEYTIDFNLLGEDEKNGDIFIICLQDKETKNFVPFMMCNTTTPVYDDQKTDEEGKTWVQKYGYRNPYTEYYMSDDANDETVYFPIVARGVVDADGTPTAIRKVDGNIEYYHDNIVIRDASDIGLSEYYLSVDQIKVHYTGLSLITNGITKLFTGKSIVEHLATSIPRFAAHTDYNFCYGVDTSVMTTSKDGLVAMSYNFGRGNNYHMDYAYDIGQLNLVLLCIGTFCMFLALMKALFGAIGRVFDVTLDFLLGPFAISTIALKSDDKSKKGMQESVVTYDNWKAKTISDVLSVIAFAVGFNAFFILVPVINSMQLFSSTVAFDSLPLFRHISLSFLNEIGRFLFICGLAYMTSRAPELFSGIMNLENGFSRGEDVMNNVKNMTEEVKNTWSGKNAVNDLKVAKEFMKNSIPGIQLVEKGAEYVNKANAFVASKAIEYYARANGVSPQLAKALGRGVRDAMTQEKTKNDAKPKPRPKVKSSAEKTGDLSKNSKNKNSKNKNGGGSDGGSGGSGGKKEKNAKKPKKEKKPKAQKAPKVPKTPANP